MSRLAWTLVALFVLTRLVLVASVADVFGYGEECGKAAAAKAILDRLPVEHYRLAYVYHEGGGFVVTHLKALAFLLVGPTVLANKLVALFTSVLALLAGVRLAYVHFGRRAAWCFGLAFVFAPDAFLRFSLLSLGTHFEVVILIALVVHFTLRIAAGSGPAASASTWLGLGVALGFGVYFSLVTLAALVWSALVLVVAARAELTARRVLLAGVGALVGAAPLLWMMSHVGLDAVRVRAREGGASSSVTRWEATRDLASAFTRGELGPWLVALAIAVMVAAGWRVLGAHPDPARRRKLLVVGSFVPVFLLLYVASGLAIRPDVGWFFFLRLSPVWYVATFAAVACGATALDVARSASANATASASASAGVNASASASGARTLVLAAMSLLVGVGVVDLVTLARAGRPAHPLENLARCATTNGCDYAEYFDKLQQHLEGSIEDKIAVLRRFDERPSLLLPAIELSLFEHAGVSLSDAIAITKRAFGDEWPIALQGLRFFVHPEFGHDIPAAFDAIRELPEPERASLAHAIGRAGLGPRFVPDKIRRQVELETPSELRTPYLEGAGWRIERAFPLRPDLARELIERCPSAARAPLTEGYVSAVAERSTRAGR